MDLNEFRDEDLVNIPPDSLFLNVNIWLKHLSESFSRIVFDYSDPDVYGMMKHFNEKIITAKLWMRKTQMTVNQYKLINARVCLLEDKIDRAGRPENHFSSWNQLQVLSGIKTAYSEYLMKCSLEMVDSCLTADSLYQDIIEHELSDAEEPVYWKCESSQNIVHIYSEYSLFQ